MNSRLGIIFILIPLTALLAWWLWSRPEPFSLPPPEVIAEVVRSLTGERKRQRERAAERSLNEWRTPIEFYGKVVDENTQPVVGVAVRFSCNDTSVEGTSYYQAVSDGQGLFSITGIKGKLLTVAVSKTGYYTSKRDTDSFYYAGQNQNFVPTRNGPILFHLRKHGQAEPLVTMDYPGFAQIAQLPRNGTPVKFDLLHGTTNISGAGHVRFEFLGDPISRETKRFNWKFQITATGGLVETDEEFPFSAPEQGYQPMIEINAPLTLGEEWRNTVTKKYFIRLHDGRYGRIEFSLLARNGVFTLQSALNPSGSRNLEYGEAAQTETATR